MVNIVGRNRVDMILLARNGPPLQCYMWKSGGNPALFDKERWYAFNH